MSSIPFAPVTVLDTAANVSAGNTIVVGMDYRWAGTLTYQAMYAVAFTTIGAGDSLSVEVSPDWKHDSPNNNAGAMWAQYAIVSAAGTGKIEGPWSAFRFIKPGSNGAKVVAMVAGKNRNRPDIQG